jgi:nucleolar MIF4G domain-containing protein 1
VNEIAQAAKKHHMVTDVKKAVFQAIVNSEDYLQAFESLVRLNLKKSQQREHIRVLLHCCLSEKNFNPFYFMLCQKLIRYDAQNYRYTFKYALWDYLKGLDTMSITKVVNLGKLSARLISSDDIPLHFLKVIPFSDTQKLTKSTALFLHLTLQEVLETSDVP